MAFIENKKGKLAEATRYIADHDINLKALSIADTQDFGILRIICENPEKANEVLKNVFPEYKDIQIGMPSERMRRVGQSIAAASLPEDIQ